jgi:hypothetical protein
MSPRLRKFLLGGVVLGVALVALTYPLWSPYFIDDVVDEAFPWMTDAEREAFDAMPDSKQDAFLNMSESNPEEAADTLRVQLGNDAVVPEDEQAMPDMPDEPVILKQGAFIEIDFIHGAEGSATIYQLPDGSHVLRFENFRSTNGPDLHVLLSSAADPRSSGALGDTVDLGSLKGNVGNQNYEIPADVDLDNVNSVVIYCDPFHVVFSTATLG